MKAKLIRTLVPADAVKVNVLVDNVTDSLSSVPKDVTNEIPLLMKNGTLRIAAGEYRCCAEHGLSLIITARVGRDKQTLIFDAGPEAYAITRNAARCSKSHSAMRALSCCRTATGITPAV